MHPRLPPQNMFTCENYYRVFTPNQSIQLQRLLSARENTRIVGLARPDDTI